MTDYRDLPFRNLRITAVCVTLLSAFHSHAAEEIAFPQLNSEAYCAARFSETSAKRKPVVVNACEASERWLRSAIEPSWYLVPAKVRRLLVSVELDKSRPQTYNTVMPTVADAVGNACLMTKQLSCKGAESVVRRASIAFPELDFDTYCSGLVSKMLDPDEKRAEFDKCLVQEKAMKDATAPFWRIIPDQTQVMIVSSYFGDPKFHTYGTVLKYVAYWTGRACIITKELSCEKTGEK